MADTNIKAYAKLENLFKDGEKVTSFDEFFSLDLPLNGPDNNGEYTFTKTIDVPFTSWHYPNHQFSVEVKAVNTNNNEEDMKDREDYQSGGSLNGLFRALEKDSPKFQSPSNSEAYYTKALTEIVIIADDNIQGEWYKNSGIKKDDGLILKIFKDKGTTDLFNENFLSKPVEENGVFTWNYIPDEEFTDGEWRIELTIIDNDENSKSLIKEFIIDTKAPELDVDLDSDIILGERKQFITGTTDPNIDVEVVVEQNGVSKTYTDTSGADGKFNVEIELYEGYNKITVKVTEPSGLSNFTTIDNIFVDTAAPDIISVTTSPIETEVGAGRLLITVKVRV